MTRPRTPKPGEIPQELAEAKAWCAWSTGKSDRKAPLGPDGRHADVQGANPGMSLPEALRVAEEAGGGVGLCLYGTPWAAVDADGAYEDDGLRIREWAFSILDASNNIYVETSPSGTGFHAIGVAPEGMEAGRTNTRRPGVRKEGVETFCGRGYLTVTGVSEIGPPEKLGSVGPAIDAAGAVATVWGRDDGSIVRPGIQPREGVPIASSLSAAIAADPRLCATWEGKRSDLESASEYDMALASSAAGLGASWQEAWDLVVAGRVKRGDDVRKALREDYAEMTLKRAFGTAAESAGGAPHGVALDELHAHIPSGRYIYAPSRDLWPGGSINMLIPTRCVPGGLRATTWLTRNQHVEQMTWQPGRSQIIADALMTEDGWTPHPGARVFNLYLPPRVVEGDATKAMLWLGLFRKLYPDEADELIDWFAHRVQRPDEKVNHAIVLGGGQGIGKDTLMHPLRYAVGPWNFSEVSPKQMLGRFNGFIKSVVLRVSEARDLGNVGRFDFYDHTKTLIAAPPDALRVDEKNLREYSVPNLCGVAITTNHRDGLFLPPEDRRHLVAWSKADRGDFDEGYWRKIWSWYESGGLGHVAAFLKARNLTVFDPKAPPRRTPAFKAMVSTGLTPEDSEMSDALEALRWPTATTFNRVAAVATGELGLWLGDPRKSWQVRRRMEACGYEAVANPDAADGRWKVGKKKTVIFCKARQPYPEQVKAVHTLQGEILGDK